MCWCRGVVVMYNTRTGGGGSSLDMDGPGPPTDRDLVINRNFHFPFPQLSPILFNLKTGGSPLKSTACAIRLSSKKIKHRINTK